MNYNYSTLSIAAGALALCLAVGGLFYRRSLPAWCFAIGMGLFGADCLVGAWIFASSERDAAVNGLTAWFVIQSLIPGAWLAFSLVYARGNAGDFLKGWRTALAIALVLPAGIALVSLGRLFEVLPVGESGLSIAFNTPAQILNGLVLTTTVLILVNFEKTYRAAVGTARWRVKYVLLGLALVFATKVYTLTQRLLYNLFDPDLLVVEAVALILGCVLMITGGLRKGFADLDIYPSRAVLQGSLTISLAGAYLIIVGILAQIVTKLGGASSLPAQAFLVLAGLIGATILASSDRFRSWLREFVSRHFRRAKYDCRRIWTEFTERTSGPLDRVELCREAAKVVTENFEVLSVNIYLLDDSKTHLERVVTTDQVGGEESSQQAKIIGTSGLLGPLREIGDTQGLFDISEIEDPRFRPLKEAVRRQFDHGGHEMGLVLGGSQNLLGLMILADRVNGMPYSREERELLKCVGDQIASSLSNRILTEELLQAKELESFQTMSTFFVHDLKNAANSLNLMLENLPKHFDDPEFQKDTLRGISRTSERIQRMIGRLSTLRGNPEPNRQRCDLTSIVGSALAALDGVVSRIDLKKELQPGVSVVVDREQIESVVTNLVTNAAEAIDPDGTVRIETCLENDHVILVVKDTGSGMDPDFVKYTLFRPFQSTKSNGLGIGMFQCRSIVEAHGGSIEVDSEVGKGSQFRIRLTAAERQ